MKDWLIKHSSLSEQQIDEALRTGVHLTDVDITFNSLGTVNLPFIVRARHQRPRIITLTEFVYNPDFKWNWAQTHCLTIFGNVGDLLLNTGCMNNLDLKAVMIQTWNIRHLDRVVDFFDGGSLIVGIQMGQNRLIVSRSPNIIRIKLTNFRSNQDILHTVSDGFELQEWLIENGFERFI